MPVGALFPVRPTFHAKIEAAGIEVVAQITTNRCSQTLHYPRVSFYWSTESEGDDKTRK